MKIRLSERRSRIIATKKKELEKVRAAIEPVLEERRKWLSRELRGGGNLRKRLTKIQAPTKLSSGEAALYKVKRLLPVAGNPPKNPPPVNQPHNLNEDHKWRDRFIAALIAALLLAGASFVDLENLIWTSRGMPNVDVDVEAAVRAYQDRIGRRISNIADDTMLDVQKAISDWYVSGEDFSSLMKKLETIFGPKRAERIARQEINNLNSQIALEFMRKYGVEDWVWDAMGENPCMQELYISGHSYAGCRELNGKRFSVGAPMPPDAAHVNCECIPSFDAEVQPKRRA
jgi:hypothetical protein